MTMKKEEDVKKEIFSLENIPEEIGGYEGDVPEVTGKEYSKLLKQQVFFIYLYNINIVLIYSYSLFKLAYLSAFSSKLGI